MSLFKMIEVMIKGILFVYGCVFICVLCYIMFSNKKADKKEKEKPDIRELYGTVWSIQFWSIMILLVFLTVSLVVDLFSFSVLERFVGDLSELPRSTIETYFSSLVTVIIGFVGVILIVCSVLYGSFYVAYSKGKGENVEKLDKLKNEREKLVKQCKIWLAFLVYFIAVMGVLFILPLMEQLGSIR